MYPLKAGDLFCVNSAGPLSTAIKVVERVHAVDNEASYGHAGIVISPDGATFEALARIGIYHLDRYLGQQILIARPVYRLDTTRIKSNDRLVALNQVMKRHKGKLYPFWRIPLFLLPPLAKYLSAGGRFLVCSELNAYYESLLDTISGPYTGRMPDDLADRWRTSWTHKIIYQGLWQRSA